MERLLRTYESVANTEHFCDYCHNFIHPGEVYEGMVYVFKNEKNSHVTVFKKHISPFCPPDPEEEYEEELQESLLEEITEEPSPEFDNAA